MLETINVNASDYPEEHDYIHDDDDHDHNSNNHSSNETNLKREQLSKEVIVATPVNTSNNQETAKDIIRIYIYHAKDGTIYFCDSNKNIYGIGHGDKIIIVTSRDNNGLIIGGYDKKTKEEVIIIGYNLSDQEILKNFDPSDISNVYADIKINKQVIPNIPRSQEIMEKIQEENNYSKERNKNTISLDPIKDAIGISKGTLASIIENDEKYREALQKAGKISEAEAVRQVSEIKKEFAGRLGILGTVMSSAEFGQAYIKARTTGDVSELEKLLRDSLEAFVGYKSSKLIIKGVILFLEYLSIVNPTARYLSVATEIISLISGVLSDKYNLSELISESIFDNEDKIIYLKKDETNRVEGGDQSNNLIGKKGNDLINGKGGNDYLYGGEGNDYLEGGIGNDHLSGEAGADILHGDEGNDYLYGGEGNDYLEGGIGSDHLSGEAGADILHGDEGNDYLYGGEGNDYLYGGNGDDQLLSSEGDDYLYGGLGNDILEGGEGNEKYYFNLGDGNDVINDDNGINTIIFNNNINYNSIFFYKTSSGVKITYGDSDSIYIKNISKSFNYRLIVNSRNVIIEQDILDKLISSHSIFGKNSTLSDRFGLDDFTINFKSILK